MLQCEGVFILQVLPWSKTMNTFSSSPNSLLCTGRPRFSLAHSFCSSFLMIYCFSSFALLMPGLGRSVGRSTGRTRSMHECMVRSTAWLGLPHFMLCSEEEFQQGKAGFYHIEPHGGPAYADTNILYSRYHACLTVTP